MRRRDLLLLLSSAAMGRYRSAQAQQRALPLVAFLSPRTYEGNIGAFRRGLRELGYVEGQNLGPKRSATGRNEAAFYAEAADPAGIVPNPRLASDR
jgi:hypothetical protein